LTSCIAIICSSHKKTGFNGKDMHWEGPGTSPCKPRARGRCTTPNRNLPRCDLEARFRFVGVHRRIGFGYDARGDDTSQPALHYWLAASLGRECKLCARMREGQEYRPVIQWMRGQTFTFFVRKKKRGEVPCALRKISGVRGCIDGKMWEARQESWKKNKNVSAEEGNLVNGDGRNRECVIREWRMEKKEMGSSSWIMGMEYMGRFETPPLPGGKSQAPIHSSHALSFPTSNTGYNERAFCESDVMNDISILSGVSLWPFSQA